MDRLHFCGDFDEKVGSEEKRLLPHIKRFFECCVGDSQFFAAIQKDPAACGPLLESRGIVGVDPVQLAVFVPELPIKQNVSAEQLAGKPQAQLWQQWSEATTKFREQWLARGRRTPSERFNAWRQRQINRCHSQMGTETNQGNIHATIMFELSKGCSLSCPFCGLAAEPLHDVFLYSEENAKLWKEVLAVAKQQLGTTLGTGGCYWATEPTDNPDYLKFVEDFGDVSGIYPQTTTAAPLRNLAWTRELLEFRRGHITSVDRFSILSENTLRRVHDLFSAEELVFTELILQHADSMKQFMARSGRNRDNESHTSTEDGLPDHTIACLTGYLVNMVERKVRLVSPYPPTELTPEGFRIHAEGEFSSGSQLDDFIRCTMEAHMPTQVPDDQILSWRTDLKYSPLPEGFELRSKFKRHKMQGSAHLAQLGELIAVGNLTSSQVIDELLVQHSDVLAIISSIQRLFDQALLDDGLRSLAGGKC